jgi:hypothetical protein
LNDSSATERLLFPEIFAKPVILEFDQRQGSSDGGAVLLKAAETRYGLIAGMSGCLLDPRQAGKVDHSLRDLFAQRVFSIACGYADANDSARLAADPMHKMLLDRDPVTGLDMASQPTLDPTDDPTHGAQQLSFFNSHYDNACYLPMMGFVTFNDEADQYLCAAVLRPGNVTAAAGAVGILRRLMALIRSSFSKVRIRVRLDGGFANPQLLAFLDAEAGVEYVVAMASNAVLNRKAEEAMEIARLLAGLTDQTEHVYDEVRYAAGSWKQDRRIIIKAEVVRADHKEPKDNPRFVITNMKQTPQWLYEEVYCQRGQIENRIKELHAMQIDRTSCTRFWANQFRVLLTAAAYVLMQELRLSAAATDCARAQVWTLRERFLKLGARVILSVRRIVVHLPQSFPFLTTFRNMALELGASLG